MNWLRRLFSRDPRPVNRPAPEVKADADAAHDDAKNAIQRTRGEAARILQAARRDIASTSRVTSGANAIKAAQAALNILHKRKDQK